MTITVSVTWEGGRNLLFKERRALLHLLYSSLPIISIRFKLLGRDLEINSLLLFWTWEHGSQVQTQTTHICKATFHVTHAFCKNVTQLHDAACKTFSSESLQHISICHLCVHWLAQHPVAAPYSNLADSNAAVIWGTVILPAPMVCT